MSRQRHDSKRGGDARPASETSRQRRQTQKATKTSLTSLTAPAGSHKKRPTPRSPQLIIPTSTPTSASIAPKPATPKASAPKTVTDKAASKARKSPANKPASPQREQLAAAMALADATLFIEEPPITQMPVLPEIPESPAPPDTPDVPEMLDTLDTPNTPDAPEVGETPEVPEASEVPEAPEELEGREESAQPTEPDSPTPMAQEVPPHSAADAEPVEIDGVDVDPVDVVDELDTPVTPTAVERRMPTLAVMTQRRRESATTNRRSAMTKHAAALDATDLAEELAVTSEASQAPTADTRNDAPIDGDDGADAAPEINHAPGGGADATSTQQQQPNIITRPVSARYNNRQRKIPRLPDLIWENDPHLPDLPWPMRRQSGNRPHPLPPANLLMPVVVFQTCAMAIMGLVGALLGLDNSSGVVGSWTLGGAFIAGLGSAIAYVLSEITALKRVAPYALLISQLGLLTWAMLLLGPRPSLLALAPALIEVMLLLGGTLLASILALGTMLIYAFFAGLTVSIGITPVVALDPTSAVVVDVVCIVVGMLAALWLLLAIQAGRERALAIARARRHEADVLRNLVTQFRQEAQDDTGKLEAALLQALKGHGIDPIPTEGMYRLLAETIMDTASRLEVLQRDREERLRLEGALRVVIRAVERQWLGIKPEWPGHTGTEIDELVALLRTPRLDLTYQSETESRSITPRLIPIPTLAVERDTPPPTPISRPLSSASWAAPRRRERRAELYPVPSTDEDFVTPDPNSEPNGNSPPWNDSSFWPVQDEP